VFEGCVGGVSGVCMGCLGGVWGVFRGSKSNGAKGESLKPPYYIIHAEADISLLTQA